MALGKSLRCRHDAVMAMVHKAIKAGFTVGRSVEIGAVSGTVLGYNIGTGEYDGSECPLLIETPLGVVKSRLGEVRLVR